MKKKEPTSVYYSRPQIVNLKKELIASIENEEDVEVLLQYASVMKQKQDAGQKYDESYFAKLEEEYGCLEGAFMPCCFTDEELSGVIKASENSGTVSDEEINAFWGRWTDMQ